MVETSEMLPVFNLDSSLTIAEVADLQHSLLKLLGSAPVLILVGSEVEQVDGAGIQLLAGFMKEAAEQRIEIRWSGVSLRLKSAAIQLGLGSALGLATTI